ncbi:2-hydroxyacid dehydrogenase [Halothiobacillus neapolitanus]|uniref:D-isomer specific 2-hydroxyacid dehydrogenase NAD-binding protein n=2 Tax=Halothiobacillus neapolitanus TaxID=927 RepID=D0KW10_HALNC|nr:2-hydroxyacid dehydrogenase [Halothiobacillus neapolitanus]ACX94937.1 D-isomer specific 2-hydroxyacid dehydrogenase NAD-binding protein [Halothiobacillus neapolitanus c2]
MRVAVFSSKPYDQESLTRANAAFRHELHFFEAALNLQTCSLAENAEAVCVFVHDQIDAHLLCCLAGRGVKVVALRCAGFNNVDLPAAREVGIDVVRVPAYSPYAVAEHAVAMMLTLNRHTHRAYNRVREGNFALNGLLGFDMNGKTVGIVGTGRIGTVLARIMIGFGCTVLAYDLYPNDECKALGVRYVPLDELLPQSDIISLHCPLSEETRHLIDSKAIGKMKRGAMLINTGRGALIDTSAVIAALKSGHIGALGLDVYEQEENLFFEDHSEEIIQDDVLERLMTFPNVLVTAHQGFFTREAIDAIAKITLNNLKQVEAAEPCPNQL